MKRKQPTGKGGVSLPRAARVLGVTPETLARILDVHTFTVLRSMKNLPSDASPKMKKLQRVVEMLEFTLDDRESIRAFLRHPNPGLDGETPLALLKRGDFDTVANDLLAICEGTYV